MTKRDLARQIADGGDASEKLALWAIDAVFEGIASALERGEQVSIAGFGKFSVTERAARQARDPRSGEAIAVPARHVPRFSPAMALKQSVAEARAGARA